MTEKITVHEPGDTVYTVDGYGRIRIWSVEGDGSITELIIEGE